MSNLLEELAAKVLEQTMCDICLDEFPDEELNHDPAIRDGAPVCNECYGEFAEVVGNREQAP